MKSCKADRALARQPQKKKKKKKKKKASFIIVQIRWGTQVNSETCFPILFICHLLDTIFEYAKSF